jgi:uncharacterized protein YqfA (UPF0365 family)
MDNFAVGFFAGLLCAFVAMAMFAPAAWIIAPWLKCFLSGTPVSLVQIVAMRLRGTPVGLIVDTQTALTHSGIRVDMSKVEITYVANRHRIVHARDLFELVKQSVEQPAASDQIAR